MTHGTYNTYTNKACRCEPCKDAMRVYERRRRHGDIYPFTAVDRTLLGDLLNELFPFGLTPECPAQRDWWAKAA